MVRGMYLKKELVLYKYTYINYIISCKYLSFHIQSLFVLRIDALYIYYFIVYNI